MIVSWPSSISCFLPSLRKMHPGCLSLPSIKWLVGAGSRTTTQWGLTGRGLLRPLFPLWVYQLLAGGNTSSKRPGLQLLVAFPFFHSVISYVYENHIKNKALQWFFLTKTLRFPLPLPVFLEGFLSSDGFKNGNLYGDYTSESTETAAGHKMFTWKDLIRSCSRKVDAQLPGVLNCDVVNWLQPNCIESCHSFQLPGSFRPSLSTAIWKWQSLGARKPA